MKNKILLLIILTTVFNSFSQKKIKADIRIMNFLGRLPQKTEMNSLPDNLIRILYYNKQPKDYPKIGYLNNKGEDIIEAKYNMGSDFYEDYANIIKDSVFGYVDKKGNETLFENYEEVFFYYGNTGIAKKKGKYGLINRKGDPLTSFKYVMIKNYGFNHFKATINKTKSQILSNKGNIIFNKDLKFYIQSYHFDSDSLIVFQETINGKKLNGLVNLQNQIICKPKYERISFINDNSFYAVQRNKKYGFINKEGKEVIPLIYEKVSFNINNDLIAVKKNGKWGYINRENKIIIPFIYDEAYAFLDGLAYVKKDGFYGCIDKKNKIKVDFNLEKTGYPFYTNKLALYKKGGKYGFVNKNGKIKIKAKYDKAFPFVKGLAYVELNGKL